MRKFLPGWVQIIPSQFRKYRFADAFIQALWLSRQTSIDINTSISAGEIYNKLFIRFTMLSPTAFVQEKIV